MQKTLPLAAAALAVFATPIFANVTIQDLDVTGDQFATLEEVRNAIPEMDMVDFNAIDTNGDQRLSANEINNVDAQSTLSQHSMRSMKERPLALVDADGDGFISYEDIARVHPALSKNTFQEIDANGDNRLSYAEFYTIETQTALAQCSQPSFIDLADMDANGDRFLNEDELKTAYPKATKIDFRTIDLNNDNKISAVELLSPTAECLRGKN